MLAALQVGAVLVVASFVAHVGVALAHLPTGVGGLFTYRPGEGLSARPWQRTELHAPRAFVVRTDARGLRVAEARTPSIDRADVLLVGCSFAFGWGVSYEETVGARLARATGKVVANGSVPGGSGTTATLALRRLGELRPSVVVYPIIEDHLRRHVSACAPVPLFGCVPAPHVESRGDLVLVPAPASTEAFDEALARGRLLAANRWIDAPRIAAIALGAGLHVARTRIAPSPPPPPAQQALAFVLTGLRARAEALGAELVVLFVPERLDGSLDHAPSEIRGAVPDGVTFVDASPVVAELARRPSDGPLFFVGDGHPTARTHAALADLLVPTVLRLTGGARSGQGDGSPRR